MAVDPTPWIQPVDVNETRLRIAELKAQEDYSHLNLTLDQWAKRGIKPKDHLLGEVFNTTTRAILSAETGIGKTHLGLAIGIHAAAGKDFCHWKAKRKARVLVIDGEMSAELVKERLADAEKRLGLSPDNFFCLCCEDVDGMPPLDTEEGQAWVNGLIKYLKPDFIIFDNIMSLTAGDLKDEVAWKAIVPWNRSLTKQRIGTLWINHTGHDKSRDYGTSTRIWQMDTAMVLTKLTDHPADIAFRLDFLKARQRKPSNRADYEPVNLILENDAWHTEPAEKKSTNAPNPPKNYRQAIDSLNNLLVHAEWVKPTADHVKVRAIRVDNWRNECAECGLLERDTKGNIDAASRQRFSRIKQHALECHAARIRGPWVWKP